MIEILNNKFNKNNFPQAILVQFLFKGVEQDKMIICKFANGPWGHPKHIRVDWAILPSI